MTSQDYIETLKKRHLKLSADYEIKSTKRILIVFIIFMGIFLTIGLSSMPKNFELNYIIFLVLFTFFGGGFTFLVFVYGIFPILAKNIYDKEDIRQLYSKILTEESHLKEIEKLKKEVEYLSNYKAQYLELLDRDLEMHIDE